MIRWLRRIAAVPVGLAVGGFLIQFLDGVIYRTMLPMPTDPAVPSVGMPLLPFLLMAAANLFGGSVGGSITGALAPERRRIYVLILAAIIFVLSARHVGDADTAQVVRNQNWVFVLAAVIGCLLAGFLTARLLVARRQRLVEG